MAALLLYYLCSICFSLYTLYVPTACPTAEIPAPCVSSMLQKGDKVDVYTYLDVGKERVNKYDVHQRFSSSLLWIAKGLSTKAGEEHRVNISMTKALRRVGWEWRRGGDLQIHMTVVKENNVPMFPLAYDTARLTQLMEINFPNTTNLLGGGLMKEEKQEPQFQDFTFWSGKLGVTLDRVQGGIGATVGQIQSPKVPKGLQGLRIVALDGEDVSTRRFEDITARIKAGARPLKMRLQSPPPPKQGPQWYFAPFASLVLADDDTQHSIKRPPEGLHLQYHKTKYFPFAATDTFSLLSTHYIPLASRSEAPDNLELRFRPVSLGEFRVLKQLQYSAEMLKSEFGFDNQDLDDVKHFVSHASWWMISLTYIVLVVQLFVAYQAFALDIRFWYHQSNNVGISCRTIYANLMCTAVMLVHLVFSLDTPAMVLASTVAAISIELWKAKKVAKLDVVWEGGALQILRGSMTPEEAATDQHDVAAASLMGKTLAPLLVGGACYSLLHVSHSSYLAWLLSSIADGVRFGGFLVMWPQIFINYKLKSVAHLPWQVFMYRTLNMIIDEASYHFIEMPHTYISALFRDDIVFVVYLYQLWLYPVEKKRT